MKIEATYWLGCKEKVCPTVYKTDEGTYLIQGYSVKKEIPFSLPENENVVEIPSEMFEEFIKNFKEKNSNG